MSRQYTADGRRRSSMAHANHAYTCAGEDGCGKVVSGNGARASHKAMHERKGETVRMRHFQPGDIPDPTTPHNRRLWKP